MFNRRLCAPLFLALTLLPATACRGPHPARGEADPEAGEHAMVMDDYAEDNVSVTGQKLERLPDGRSRVVARVYNRREEMLSLHVQVDFKSADGFSTGDTTNWELILIGPQETYTLRVPSLATDVASYTLRMRRPDGGRSS